MAFPNRPCGRKSFPRGLSPKDTICLQGDIFTPRICLTCPAQHFFCWGIIRQGYLNFLKLASRMYAWTTPLTCTPIIPLAEGFFWLATSFTDNKNSILQGMVVTFYPHVPDFTPPLCHPENNTELPSVLNFSLQMTNQ